MGVQKRKRTSTNAAATRKAKSTAATRKTRGSGKTKFTKKTVAKATTEVAAVDAVDAPASTPESATEPSSHTGSTTITKLTNKKRKGQVPVSLKAYVNMPIVRFNLAMDPWCEYNFAQVFDQGVEREQWTSYRLKTNVLLLETSRERYELVRMCNSLVRPSYSPPKQDTFELYRVLDARNMDDETVAWLPRPLPIDLKELVVGDLSWSELGWGESSVHVRDVVLHMTCMCFVPRTTLGNEQQATAIIDMQCSPPTPTFDNSATSKDAADRILIYTSSSKRARGREALSSRSPGSNLASSIIGESRNKRHKSAPLISTDTQAAVSREIHAVVTR